MDQNISYRSILRREFCLRKNKNTTYSLRAFARDLDISCSRISRILQGKEGLSFKRAQAMVVKLPWNKEERERFCLLVSASDARSKQERIDAQSKLNRLFRTKLQTNRFDEELMELIKNWYHLAILELIRIKNFSANSNWIAKKIVISKIEAETAWNRLLKLGLMKREGQSYKKTNTTTTTTTKNVPSKAIRYYHADILKKAKQALYQQSMQDRHFSSLTIPIYKQDKEKFFQLLTEFREKMDQFAEKQIETNVDKADAVYCLSTQFFALTKTKEPK